MLVRLRYVSGWQKVNQKDLPTNVASYKTSDKSVSVNWLFAVLIKC